MAPFKKKEKKKEVKGSVREPYEGQKEREQKVKVKLAMVRVGLEGHSGREAVTSAKS